MVTIGDPFCIFLIEADVEGSGAVGQYLDELPKDREIVVINVISKRLEGMLDRRGFTREGYVGNWSRPALHPHHPQPNLRPVDGRY